MAHGLRNRGWRDAKVGCLATMQMAAPAGGQPDYSLMAPRLRIKPATNCLSCGEVWPVRRAADDQVPASVIMGGDESELTFANGTRRVAILLDADGKIVSASPPMMVKADQGRRLRGRTASRSTRHLS